MQKPKQVSRHQRDYLITLDNGFISTPEDFKKFTNWFTGKDSLKNLKYAEISAPEYYKEGIHTGNQHQHIYLHYDNVHEFHRTNKYDDGNGNVGILNIKTISDYSMYSGDFTKWLEYIRKDNPKPGSPFISYKDPSFNMENINTPLNKDGKKYQYGSVLAQALKMTDYNEATQFLMANNPEKYLSGMKNFKTAWINKHGHEEELNHLRDQYEKRDINPWKEYLPEVQEIRKWIYTAAKTNDRMKALFIVGKSKLGKTDFINLEARLKFPCFTLRGDGRFTGYDEDRNYKFIVFDDVKWKESAQITDLKALISSYGSKANMDVKYDIKRVTSRPCMFVMNPSDYKLFWKKIYRLGDTEWWMQNTKVINLTKPIFYTKKELDSLKEMSEENTQPTEPNSDAEIDTNKLPPIVEEREKENIREGRDERDRSSSRHNSPERPDPEINDPNNHVSFRERFIAMYKELKGIEDSDDEEILSLQEKWNERNEQRKKDHERYEKWKIHNMRNAFTPEGDLMFKPEEENESFIEEEREEEEKHTPQFNGKIYTNHEDSVLTEEYEENQKEIPVDPNEYVGDYEEDTREPFSKLPPGQRYNSNYDIIYD